MSNYSARLVYPKQEFQVILQNSRNSNEFYGVDLFEKKKLNIIMAKYKCRHSYNNLPDHITLDLNRFIWNGKKACYDVDLNSKVTIRLNLLEETIFEYMPDTYYQY
jgi:hypothetical protein